MNFGLPASAVTFGERHQRYASPFVQIFFFYPRLLCLAIETWFLQIFLLSLFNHRFCLRGPSSTEIILLLLTIQKAISM